jgi:hypothetical protein
MQGYLWIIWVKLAGALWIIGGELGSSLIFYFVAIDDWRSMIRDKCMPKPILSWAQVPQGVKRTSVTVLVIF